jgi:hypothetical protein
MREKSWGIFRTKYIEAISKIEKWFEAKDGVGA